MDDKSKCRSEPVAYVMSEDEVYEALYDVAVSHIDSNGISVIEPDILGPLIRVLAVAVTDEAGFSPQPADPVAKESLTVAEPVKTEPDLRGANPIGLTPPQKELQRKQYMYGYPAEPVNVPSDAEVDALAHEIIATSGAWENWKNLARRILTRYGQPAQPAASADTLLQIVVETAMDRLDAEETDAFLDALYAALDQQGGQS